MTVSIRMLGGFHVQNGEATVIDGAWKPAKGAAIVKILALQPRRTMHRDQLIDLLWPEAGAEAGSSSFYKNVHHLRAAARKVGLDDMIALSRGTVSLTEGAVLDIDTLREDARLAFASREIAGYERAIARAEESCFPETFTSRGRRAIARSFGRCSNGCGSSWRSATSSGVASTTRSRSTRRCWLQVRSRRRRTAG